MLILVIVVLPTKESKLPKMKIRKKAGLNCYYFFHRTHPQNR